MVHTADALEIPFMAIRSRDDSVIKLGDIVTYTDDTEMARALATLTVEQAPAPGNKCSLLSKNHI